MILTMHCSMSEVPFSPGGMRHLGHGILIANKLSSVQDVSRSAGASRQMHAAPC